MNASQIGPGASWGRAGRRRRLVLRSVVTAALLVPFGAAIALAHPLGNFTINHHEGIRVEPDRVLIDVVIDEAEIPAFQSTQALDSDGDGVLSAAELEAGRASGCESVGAALHLDVAGAALPMRLLAAGLSFPPGNGGLSTMRLVCTIEAPLAAPMTGTTTFTFRDDFEPSRLGWREITVQGDDTTVTAPGVPATSDTKRLTTYPSGLTGAPDVRSASFTAAPGGPSLPAFTASDAQPIGPLAIGPEVAVPVAGGASSSASAPSASASSSAAPAAVPGGEGVIPDVLRSSPVTPAIALVALLTAALLGAGHAVTPGHGKTLMAAYLVGTRGTPRHALGLGLAVSVSHTAGILALALVVIAAERALPPDLVVRLAPLVAAVTIVAIGGWMLITEARRWRARRAASRLEPASDHAHVHGHEHTDAGEADHAHDRDHPHARVHDESTGHTRAHARDDGEHEHGGVRHRHLPPAGATITWRSLFVLGLAGGLIPSTNALLVLLATIASGRPAWGVVLVVAFGLGMAAVMAGVGLAFVYARGLLERAPSRTRLASVARLVPTGAAILVLAVGVVLTSQALAAAPFR